MKSPIDQMAHVQNHIRSVRTMFTGHHVATERQSYDGAELRPFTGRPGSMDAYALPSVVDGVKVPYTGIRPQCVGALKDDVRQGRG